MKRFLLILFIFSIVGCDDKSYSEYKKRNEIEEEPVKQEVDPVREAQPARNTPPELASALQHGIFRFNDLIRKAGHSNIISKNINIYYKDLSGNTKGIGWSDNRIEIDYSVRGDYTPDQLRKLGLVVSEGTVFFARIRPLSG